MAIQIVAKKVHRVVFAAGLVSALASCDGGGQLSAAPSNRQDRVDAFCRGQGSADGISQCQQYYLRTVAVEPPSPFVFRQSDGGGAEMDPAVRAALIGALTARSQPVYQPYMLPMPVQPPVYQAPVSHSFSCYRSGNYVNCN